MAFSNRRITGGEVEPNVDINETSYVRLGDDLYKYDENGELVWVGAYEDFVTE